MSTILILASEELVDKTWWNPYLKGALITAFAVGLFVGSAYLLLYTDVGSRLGFLLTAAAFTGWMAINSLAWVSSQFPQGPKGAEPSWKAKEQVAAPTESHYARVRDIETKGHKASDEVTSQVHVDLDAELAGDLDGFLDLFSAPTDYVVVQAYELGGGRKWPVYWSEKTRYVATEICPSVRETIRFGEPPPPPRCDTSKPTTWIVSIRDLGSLRLKGFFVFGGSVLLFVITLVALRRYERDAAGVAAGDGAAGNGSVQPTATT